jgi:hypothetical protein
MKHILLSKNIIPIIIIFLVFILFWLGTFRTNIHGDAKFHTLHAKESVFNNNLVKSQSYRLYSNDENKRVYMPISYPLTSEALFTILYLFGGEVLLKLYSPIFAVFIFLFTYLLLRNINLYFALVTGIVATLVNSERLLMTPMIEPYILVTSLAALYCLFKYFSIQKLKYLIISSILFSISIAIKQQGLLFIVPMLIFLVSYYLLKVRKFPKNLIIIHLSLFISTITLLPFPAIKEQISRTGTFAYSPGQTDLPKTLPFYSHIQPKLTSNFPIKPQASEAIKLTINYNKVNLTYLDKLKGFLLVPFLYYRSVNISNQLAYFHGIAILFIIFTIIGFYTGRNSGDSQLLFTLILIGSLYESVISFILKTPITQYHTIGITLVVILLCFSLFRLYKYINIYVYFGILSLFSFYITKGYMNYIYPLWFTSGREDNYHLEGYKRIGEYVNSNISSDKIFLSGETSFRYYAQRDTVWINENLGKEVYDLLRTNDIVLASSLISKLRIDYVVINKDQHKRKGLNDYLPPEGLVSLINNPLYFEQIYDPYLDNHMGLYKLIYK